MTRERSLKNLNQVVLVVSSKSPGPGYRRQRFSRLAELSIALTLFSNLVELPRTIGITFDGDREILFRLFLERERRKKRFKREDNI